MLHLLDLSSFNTFLGQSECGRSASAERKHNDPKYEQYKPPPKIDVDAK
jgi:hypothetical protein